MKQLINVFVCLSLVALVFSGCKKDGPFKGKDNDIASFQLTVGSTVLRAYIRQDSIIVTAPGTLSLAGIFPSVVISEGATITPDPSSVTNWEQPQQFAVISHNGM